MREDRPNYIPSWWTMDRPITKWMTRSARRALLTYALLGALAAALLFWKVAATDSFGSVFGVMADGVLPFVLAITLGFCWYFGLRALATVRQS